MIIENSVLGGEKMPAALLNSRSTTGLIVANWLTFLRVICAVFIWRWAHLKHEVDLMMFAVGVFGGATDALDGLAARLLNGRSKFGALFDKGADKFFVLTCAFSLYFYCSPLKNNLLGSTMGYFLIILAGMEFFLALAGGIFAFMNKTRLEANQWGKAKMWTEGIALASWGFYLVIDPSGEIFLANELTINFLLIVAISLAAKSGYDYCLNLPG